jgi:hypothetical protein
MTRLKDSFGFLLTGLHMHMSVTPMQNAKSYLFYSRSIVWLIPNFKISNQLVLRYN